MAGDFDGDGRTDLTVFRSAGSLWHAGSRPAPSASCSGLGGDLIALVTTTAMGDDQTIFRPSSGTWHFWNSSAGVSGGWQWGLPNDIPVPISTATGGRMPPLSSFERCLQVRYQATRAIAVVQWGASTTCPRQAITTVTA